MSSQARSIRVLHLYPDLLNLYGENGNVRVLTAALRAAGQPVQVIRRSLGDELDFSGVDLVHIGCGTEPKQLLALRHLAGYRQDLQAYLDKGGLLLATGNAGDLFGQAIIDTDGTGIDALGLFDYRAERLAKREAGEVLFHYGERYLLGFQNRGSRIHCQLEERSQLQPLFIVEKGFPTEVEFALGAAPSQPDDAADPTAPSQPGVATDRAAPTRYEGLSSQGFFTTSVLGFLSRNPACLTWFCQSLICVRNTQISEVEDSSSPQKIAWPPTRTSTTSAVEDFDLYLDIVAFQAFLANHHNIFTNVTEW